MKNLEFVNNLHHESIVCFTKKGVSTLDGKSIFQQHFQLIELHIFFHEFPYLQKKKEEVCNIDCTLNNFTYRK